LLGGLYGVIFGVAPFIVNKYQEFRIKSELVAALYKESDEDQNSNPLDLKQKIAKTKPFIWTFKDWAKNTFSCCFAQDEARLHRQQKFEVAEKRMEREFDILGILKDVRKLDMLTNLQFSQHQTLFVDYADMYIARLEEPKKDTLNINELEHIISSFDTIENKVDRKLANYLAGRRLNETELSDFVFFAGRSEILVSNAAKELYKSILTPGQEGENEQPSFGGANVAGQEGVNMPNCHDEALLGPKSINYVDTETI
jgi:hypothetical protein